LIRFDGDFVNGGLTAENWSYGLRTSSIPVQSVAGDMAEASALATHWFNTLGGVQPPQVVLKKVTVVGIDAAGKWQKNPDGSFQKGEWQGAIAGLSPQDSQHPLQTAVAITLLTARAGSTGKGRIFLPYSQGALEPDGRLAQAKALAIGTELKDLVNLINASAYLPNVVVASSKGYTSEVTSVKCGRVVDTLRSRRRSQVEQYVNVAL